MDEERESLGVQPAVDLIPESDPVQQELQDDGFVEEMLNLPATQATAVPAPTAVKKSAPRRKNVVRNEARGTGKGDDLEIVRDDLSVAARLPVGRIKNIMKMDPQARNMAGDSVYLMCKAAVRRVRTYGLLNDLDWT